MIPARIAARGQRVRMASTVPAGRLFLGLDSSTQGLKATVIDEKLNVVATHAVNYQKEFSAYGIQNGVQAGANAAVTQPTVMVRTMASLNIKATKLLPSIIKP